MGMHSETQRHDEDTDHHPGCRVCEGGTDPVCGEECANIVRMADIRGIIYRRYEQARRSMLLARRYQGESIQTRGSLARLLVCDARIDACVEAVRECRAVIAELRTLLRSLSAAG